VFQLIIAKSIINACYAILFQQNFEKWSSGDDDIDIFIQNTQLTTHNDVEKALE
jgi:hypothetical protein